VGGHGNDPPVIYNPDLARSFTQIRSSFATPEDINNGPETAPSKRILKLYPAYQKPIHGSLAACEIGIKKIRVECKHFDEWVMKLERIGMKK
jgi:hypothetical protein